MDPKISVVINTLNEEQNIERAIKSVNWADEIIVCDMYSKDKTIEVAKKFGVDRIIIHKKNQGLGNAFKHGMESALESGADIFVNTDADNQYCGADIARLIEPILADRALHHVLA